MPTQRTRRAATTRRAIRLVVVEPSGLVRALLREIVGSQPDMQIAAEASSVDDAIAIIREETPAVVLLDTDLPISAMVPTVQRLRRECPGSQVVLLGRDGGDDELFAALQAGAAARVVDDARPSELLRAIRAAADGEYPIDETVAARPEVARRVLDAFRDPSILDEVATAELGTAAFAPLSSREAEILEAIAEGMRNREVAERFAISEATVKNHVTSILRKLAVNGRTQAVLYALRQNWITLAEDQSLRN